MARNTALFQNTANTKSTRPPRLGAPLRYGPRPYLSPYAASLSLRRTGLNFLFLRSPGFHGSRLRCCAAPPRKVAVPPRALLKFSGILLLFDVQSSTTEKEQKDRHLLFLRRGGARTPGWDYTRTNSQGPLSSRFSTAPCTVSNS